MTTALETITGALRLLKVIGAGQTATGEDATTGLAVLNEMLEEWSIQNLNVFTPVDQTFTLVPGTASYTIGPTGAFVGFRPIQIDSVRVTMNSIVYMIEHSDNDRFNAIPYPTQAGPLPLLFNYDPTATNGTMFLWPVPSLSLPLTIASNQQLAQIPTLATVLTYPPGYAKAIRFNLAKDLAEEYERALSANGMQIAASSLGHLRRANLKPVPADFDPALTGGGGQGSYYANFLAGNG